MVLACATGQDNKTVAGLMDEPRPGAPRQVTDEQIEDVIIRTLKTTPRGATHWSTRDIAKATARGDPQPRGLPQASSCEERWRRP